jgi:alkylated DNA repair dioxygenase AlkB
MSNNEATIEVLNVLPYEGEALLYKGFIKKGLFESLKDSIEWKQGQIKLYGKVMNEGRLTAWYGDEGTVYNYSGKVNIPLAWTPELIQIKEFLKASGIGEYNSCLLNYYRDGNDSIGMHSDDERELDSDIGIASITVGGTRDFVFKHKDTGQTVKVLLQDGDLLLMKGETQAHWKHGIPRRAQAQPRINLTFRSVKK